MCQSGRYIAPLLLLILFFSFLRLIYASFSQFRTETNYRHIIDWLVRKPGAFANYRYRSELFPTSHFRIAHDLLREQNPGRADKEYLQILYCAARQSEEIVNRALQQIIAEGSTLTAESVEVLVQWLTNNNMPQVTDAAVSAVDLGLYDNLLDFERRAAV